jgi:hypothetical protein
MSAKMPSDKRNGFEEILRCGRFLDATLLVAKLKTSPTIGVVVQRYLSINHGRRSF